MIPLAQFLSDENEDEFVPLRAQAPRRPPVAAPRAFEAGLPRVSSQAVQAPRMAPKPATAAAPAMRPTAMPAKALQAAGVAPVQPRPTAEPRVPLREVEAERRAWAKERETLLRAHEIALAQAHQDGAAEAEEAVRQDLERVSAERIEALRQTLAADHEGALADARRQWVETEGDRLADLVILQMAVFEDALKTTLSALLRPLVLDARKRMTVDELAGAVKTIAFDGTTVKIAASGPSDLLHSLEGKLGDHARHVSFDPDETHTDVRIDANQTVIETRLAAWLKAVEEALS
ncbi:hypothetical protein [uncultured Aureimonas sp.]|uniref:hypothetical protein n=1 Tax=uncultured Aureimonas sp. TaxID=1604662 RepID=UPI0025E2A51A|nr:hypothetical protein [uncultured Aureimonas sp.]